MNGAAAPCFTFLRVLLRSSASSALKRPVA
jgi:hypothetical protein